MKYWYKITDYECPVCGRGGSYRERVYKEEEKDRTYKWRYDYCDQ